MDPFLWLILTVFDLLIFLVFAYVVISLLVGFQVLNTRNQIVYFIYDALYRVTNPLIAPIRRRMPNTGNFDFSPAVLLIGLLFIERVIVYFWPI
jgi:YggT family protein